MSFFHLSRVGIDVPFSFAIVLDILPSPVSVTLVEIEEDDDGGDMDIDKLVVIIKDLPLP